MNEEQLSEVMKRLNELYSYYHFEGSFDPDIEKRTAFQGVREGLKMAIQILEDVNEKR